MIVVVYKCCMFVAVVVAFVVAISCCVEWLLVFMIVDGGAETLHASRSLKSPGFWLSEGLLGFFG